MSYDVNEVPNLIAKRRKESDSWPIDGNRSESMKFTESEQELYWDYMAAVYKIAALRGTTLKEAKVWAIMSMANDDALNGYVYLDKQLKQIDDHANSEKEKVKRQAKEALLKKFAEE